MNVRVEFLLEAFPPLPPIVTIFNFQLKQIIHVGASFCNSFAKLYLPFMGLSDNSIRILTSMKQAIRPCAELKRVEV